MRAAILSALLLAGCRFDVTIEGNQTTPEAPTGPPPLPVTVSNNAVALVQQPGGGYHLISMAGLVNGTTWRDVSNRVFVWSSAEPTWREMAPVPGEQGRLAATAQAVAGEAYFFGGYTVAEDGSEVSTPEVYALDPQLGTYRRLPDMPVPVDDTVSAVWRDRFIYLVSGWHDTGNVANVQVFDTQTQTWAQATPYPGPAVSLDAR